MYVVCPALLTPAWAAPTQVATQIHNEDNHRKAASSFHAAQHDDIVMRLSVRINTLLLLGKALACTLSASPAILASLVDSAVDVAVQAGLYHASHEARKRHTHDENYPVGRGQLEPVALVVCAALKCAGMALVVFESAMMLRARDHEQCGTLSHDRHHHGLLHIWRHHWESVALLAAVSAVKFGFCVYCEVLVRGRSHGGVTTAAARAVAADNQNDVILSAGALVATVITQIARSLWWVDPAVALVLALFVLRFWLRSGRQQLDLVIGRTADRRFLESIRELSLDHESSGVESVDKVRAYHWGPRLLVELEVVMNASTPLSESAEVGMDLQRKVEALHAVERCFVRLDYQRRELSPRTGAVRNRGSAEAEGANQVADLASSPSSLVTPARPSNTGSCLTPNPNSRDLLISMDEVAPVL